jgi:hypothetical protein
MSLLKRLQIVENSEPETETENGLQLEQDPEPGEKARAARRPRTPSVTAAKPKPTTRTTAQLSKQVAEDLASLIEGGAAVWGLTDECCAPTLEAQAKPIADALTGVLARNPRLLAAFASTDIVAYTLHTAALGRALAPVGKAIYRNHVSGAVPDGEATGHDATAPVRLGDFPAYGVPRTNAA